MSTDKPFLARLYESTGRAIALPLALVVAAALVLTKMLKIYIKVLMDLVYIWYYYRCWSRVVHIDDEVNARIAKANAAFGRLCGSIWDRSGIRLDTKLKVYRLVVLPTLLYAC